VKPGAPGIGRVKKILTEEISVIMICFSPISTNKFIKERLSQINGLGGIMVNKLMESKNYEHFQEMSLEFANYIDVMTPKMQKLVNELYENNIKCGIALFGETIFSMIPKKDENKILEILKKYPEGIIIKSELDNVGARVLNN
jgi:pantoate kinase